MVGRLYEICKGTAQGLRPGSREKYLELWTARATGVPVLPKPKPKIVVRPACAHQGGEVDTRVCVQCGGNVRVKVFACEEHGQCTLVKPIGMKCCASCEDYQGKEEAGGSL